MRVKVKFMDGTQICGDKVAESVNVLIMHIGKSFYLISRDQIVTDGITKIEDGTEVSVADAYANYMSTKSEDKTAAMEQLYDAIGSNLEAQFAK